MLYSLAVTGTFVSEGAPRGTTPFSTPKKACGQQRYGNTASRVTGLLSCGIERQSRLLVPSLEITWGVPDPGLWLAPVTWSACNLSPPVITATSRLQFSSTALQPYLCTLQACLMIHQLVRLSIYSALVQLSVLSVLTRDWHIVNVVEAAPRNSSTKEEPLRPSKKLKKAIKRPYDVFSTKVAIFSWTAAEDRSTMMNDKPDTVYKAASRLDWPRQVSCVTGILRGDTELSDSYPAKNRKRCG
ncbi:hypothetical protein J6590_007490 [Homalodisca vitripennis]|nr:hypothetical protein J6590_007490 [Homalodisca vitripennis]